MRQDYDSFIPDLKTPPIDHLTSCLLKARRRMALQTFLAALARGALGASAVLVIAAAFFRWRIERWPLHLGVVAAAAFAVFFATAAGWRRRRSLSTVAGIIDRAGQTHDRFITALAFSRETEASEMRAMAVRECAAFVRTGRFDRIARLRWPREFGWLLVPLITLAMLQWEARTAIDGKDAESAEARSTVEETAKKLEALANETEKAQTQTPGEELKKMAERLRQGAEQVRAKATNPEEAAKAAMRELSALEQLVQEMQKSHGGASPEEMKALADALAKNEATKDAATAIQAGDTERAAAELEQALKNMDASGAKTASELTKELQDALKQLAAQKQLSEAMQKLAQQMQRSQAQKGGDGSEAMRQLAQMLRQMQQGKEKGQPQQGGSDKGSQTLQNLLAALQNMKYGEGEKDGASKPQEGKGSSLVAVQSFGTDKPGKNPGDPNQPSGHPGSERDEGTTESPFGKERQESGKEAQTKQMTGRLGDGESMQQFVPSAGDNSKSNRRYKELYKAMAPAAEDAVVQENIPLGSRFFIKRYFEAIRPQE